MTDCSDFDVVFSILGMSVICIQRNIIANARNSTFTNASVVTFLRF